MDIWAGVNPAPTNIIILGCNPCGCPTHDFMDIWAEVNPAPTNVIIVGCNPFGCPTHSVIDIGVGIALNLPNYTAIAS